MKRWLNKTPGELWIDLFVREKTRWVAVVLFLGAVIVANWSVIDAALEGRTFARFGRTVTEASEPLSFSFWVTWRTAIAVVLDLVLLWAVIHNLERQKEADPAATDTTGSSAPDHV